MTGHLRTTTTEEPKNPFAASRYQPKGESCLREWRSGEPSDIPVIIVQVGHWAQSMDTGSEIAQAQANFVLADSNAALIRTKDLSWFYHHDEATQLIVGDQIALKMHRKNMLSRSSV